MPASTPSAARCRCVHLRTKMDYVTSGGSRPSGLEFENGADDAIFGSSNSFYCLHTMTVIGPDNDVVEPRACCAERDCYESSGF